MDQLNCETPADCRVCHWHAAASGCRLQASLARATGEVPLAVLPRLALA